MGVAATHAPGPRRRTVADLSGHVLLRARTDGGVVHPRTIQHHAAVRGGVEQAEGLCKDGLDAGLGEMAVRTPPSAVTLVGSLALGSRVFIRNLWKRSGSFEDRPSGRRALWQLHEAGGSCRCRARRGSGLGRPLFRPGVEGPVPRHDAMRSSSIPSITVTSAGSCWRSGRATEPVGVLLRTGAPRNGPVFWFVSSIRSPTACTNRHQ